MKVTDIIQTENQGDVIQEMKSHRFIPQPDVEAAKKVLDPQEHDINNPIIRPDKRVNKLSRGNATHWKRQFDPNTGKVVFRKKFGYETIEEAKTINK